MRRLLTSARFRYCPAGATVFRDVEILRIHFSAATQRFPGPSAWNVRPARSPMRTPTPLHSACPAYKPVTGIKGLRDKTSAQADAPRSNADATFFAVHPRRAELFERCLRSPADGNNPRFCRISRPGIDDRALQRTQVGRRRNPADASTLEKIIAMPILHGDERADPR